MKFSTFFRNKKILITGSTGFVGSWLFHSLVMLGSDVYGFGLEQDNPNHIHNILKKNKKFQKIININNLNKVNGLIKEIKPEIIIHLAAQPIVSESFIDPYGTYKTNVLGTLNLLEALRKNNKFKCFINFTTDKVYEQKKEKKKYFSEQDSLGGNNIYSISKSASDLLSSNYQNNIYNSNIGVSSIRSGNLFGGGDFSKNRIIPDLIQSYFDNKKFIIRNPSFTRPWFYILDCIYLILKIIIFMYENPKLNSGPWNLSRSTKNPLTVMQLVKKFIKLNDLKNFEIIYHQKKIFKEDKFLVLNNNKIKKYIKWKPVASFDQNIVDTYIWYEKLFYDKKGLIKYMDNNIENYIL